MIRSLGFVLLTGLLVLAYVALSWPRPAPQATLVQRPVSTALAAAVTPAGLAAPLAEIAACGPRLLGRDGLERTAALIERTWRSAGLDVLSLPTRTPWVVTSTAVLTPVIGPIPAGLQVWAAGPNLIQPAVTAPGGLVGTLVLATPAAIATGRDFTGAIALVDAAAPVPGLGFAWPRYAAMGFSGVVVTHAQGIAALDWATMLPELESEVPVNFPRAFATPAVLALAGMQVRLELSGAWREVEHRALVAVLPAAEPASEAVVVSVPYDQVGALADLVPGSAQDLPLAAQLALAKALPALRGNTTRDVILVATAGTAAGQDGLAWLLSAAGAQQGGNEGRAWWARRAEATAAERDTLDRLITRAARPGFLTEPAATVAALADLDQRERDLLAAALRHAVGEQVRSLQETVLARRIDLERAPANGREAVTATYVAARQEAESLSALVAYPADKLASNAAALVAKHALDRRLAERLAALRAERGWEADQAAAAVAVGQRFANYRALSVIEPVPAGTGSERITLHCGREIPPEAAGQALAEHLQRIAGRAGVSFTGLQGKGHVDAVEGAIARLQIGPRMWMRAGYAATGLVHLDRTAAYRILNGPAAVADPTGAAGLLRLTADTVASLAAGEGQIPLPRRPLLRPFQGRVLASGVGAGIIPTHPLGGAVVTDKAWDHPAKLVLPGHRLGAVLISRLDGGYVLPLGPWQMLTGQSYSPACAAFGADGLATWVKDGGPRAQSQYRSNDLGTTPPVEVNVVTFRAAPVTVLDRVDPGTLQPFASLDTVQRDSLATPDSQWVCDSPRDGLFAAFVRPSQRVLVRFKGGSPDQPLVQSVRAVLVGAPLVTGAPEAVVPGLGLLAADRPWVATAAADAAASLLRINAPRLALQQRQGLTADGVAVAHERAAALVAGPVVDPAASVGERLVAAREAAAWGQANHGRLAATISAAVANIVWYLFLLVPFALFMEKLAVGATDVRKQIAVASGIFLAAFLILAALHPAFALLHSPVMILLGFAILLIALGVSAIFLGRFKENLAGLNAQRGNVQGAQADTAGVLGTAVLLGLNGLSRRKVRTGLTTATLVLITVAMICFTAGRTEQQEQSTATGPAPYQGLLVAGEGLAPLTADEVSALRAQYGLRHRVVARSLWVGSEKWDTNERGNPRLGLDREGRMAALKSLLQWEPGEPLAAKLRLLSGTMRLDPPASGPLPLAVSERTAEALGIAPAAIPAAGVPLRLNGREVLITAVFASASLEALRDLDGQSVLPFDIEAMSKLKRNRAYEIVTQDGDPRLSAAALGIAPAGALGCEVPFGSQRTVSAAVVLDGLPYKEARALISGHLERSGRAAAYGLDGTAWIGRMVERSASGGLVELLVPLLIAALTVLNTMRGSVYERRTEIEVFNAVGIAPRYIAAMFFAEALVYAVVGSVLGYLLALILGRGLAVLGWNAGLDLDVASLAPVWASLALAAAVFLSTWFPAKAAARIAAPAEDAGWRMPEPVNDGLTIELPFAFDHRDRVGVLAFFARWFRDHGDGGAGSFQCAEPVIDALNQEGAAVPRLSCRMWLKPFDLGVAQDLAIELRPDGRGEFIAFLVLTRRNGTNESWLRLNRAFLTEARRHFLFWRAVDAAERERLFVEGCKALQGVTA